MPANNIVVILMAVLFISVLIPKRLTNATSFIMPQNSAGAEPIANLSKKLLVQFGHSVKLPKKPEPIMNVLLLIIGKLAPS